MTTRKYSSRSQQTTLTSAVTSGATVLPVTSATTLLGGVTISAGQTFTVVIDPDTALEEIVDVYSASGNPVSANNLTIVRAIDGSSAQDHSAGAVVRHMIIGRDLREANTHIETSVGVHGIGATSSVVGTLDAQTLTNKTLTSPVINNPTITGQYLGDAGIVFEGSTPDSYETTLSVVDPTADRTVSLPDATGTVILDTATQTISNKTLGSNLAAGGYTITGLATPVNASDAVRKDFADAQVAAAATSAASAATSASSAAASATTAANSVATIASYATTASNSAAAAATSATSAAASATAAATSATSAAASATAAATSATSAAASATSASNSASAASTSATSAAASATAAATSATSAAASATTAANSVATIASYATTASNSAAAAATSATSAAASATAAATSASSAATSASSAATTYTAYDARYLGSKASAPSVDNQGGTLIVGATYWNTTTTTMYVWSGSAWNAISSASAVTSVLGTAGRVSSTGGTAPQIDLVTTAVTPGSYTNSSFTVDTYGRLTAASNGTAPVTSISGTAGQITVTGTTTPTLSLNTTAVTAGSYTAATITVDAYGRITAASSTTPYSAPTIGSTSIGSGATVTTINGLTKIVSATVAKLDANGYEQDFDLLTIMGAI